MNGYYSKLSLETKTIILFSFIEKKPKWNFGGKVFFCDLLFLLSTVAVTVRS